MSTFLIAATSFTVMLCFLVLLHEWGHFAAARLLGVRVEVFSLGFGPRLMHWKRGATEYRLSALPFGGYVRMAGDSASKPRTGAADEYLSKTRWQRVVIALAGPAMNLVMTVLLFWASFWLVGLPYPAYLTRAANVAAVAEGSQTSEIHAGDVITQVDGVNTPSWDAVLAQAAKAKAGSDIPLVVIRNGIRVTVTVQKDANDTSYLGYPLVQPRVDSVTANSPASKAGLKAGDLVKSVDGDALVTWPQFVDMVRESSAPYPVIVVLRGRKTVPLHISEPADSRTDVYKRQTNANANVARRCLNFRKVVSIKRAMKAASQSRSSRSLLPAPGVTFMPGLGGRKVRAAVLIINVTWVADVPLNVTGFCDAEQFAPDGSPLQPRLTG